MHQNQGRGRRGAGPVRSQTPNVNVMTTRGSDGTGRSNRPNRRLIRRKRARRGEPRGKRTRDTAGLREKEREARDDTRRSRPEGREDRTITRTTTRTTTGPDRGAGTRYQRAKRLRLVKNYHQSLFNHISINSYFKGTMQLNKATHYFPSLYDYNYR